MRLTSYSPQEVAFNIINSPDPVRELCRFGVAVVLNDLTDLAWAVEVRDRAWVGIQALRLLNTGGGEAEVMRGLVTALGWRAAKRWLERRAFREGWTERNMQLKAALYPGRPRRESEMVA